MDRRSFLLGAGALAAASALPLKAHSKSDKAGLSILQGLTTETTTQLSVDVEKDQKVVYELLEIQTGRRVEPEYVKSSVHSSNDTRVDKIKFSNLQLGHRYKLTVRDTKRKKILDERFLSTVDLKKSGAKIALMSCMNDMFGDRDKIWRAAEKADIDYIFFLGDTVYADFLFLYGPGYYWSRFVDSRKNIPFYRWKNLKPVIAVWDDHDFGKNDAGASYKYKDQAFKMFKTFFAQEPDGINLTNGYGNSTLFQAFNQNFAFFDNRYYRGLANRDGSAGFLGHDQIDWMIKGLQTNSNPTWIMEGSPFYSGVEKKGSYFANAPAELDYLMRKIKSLNAPVLFAAGDLHLSEIATVPKEILGYETYELISSAMHSTSKKKFYSHPHTQLKGYLKENFLMLEQSSSPGDAVWKVTCIGEKSVPFKAVLQVG